MDAAVKQIQKSTNSKSGDPYVPPANVVMSSVGEILRGIREIPEQYQSRFGITPEGNSGVSVWSSGDISLLRSPCVAIVGARNVSTEGAARARRLGRELARAGIVVVSGLAKGVDTEALTAAIEAGGKTIAVIGTPISQAYPAQNKRLQEAIYSSHLLISQFAEGKRVFPSNFPERNKLMAAISDATVIVEATDESGSLHQAAECTRLNRWLFIAASLAQNPALLWPQSFLHYPTTRILNATSDVIETISAKYKCH